MPILKKNTDTEAVLAAADSLAEAAKAAGLRVKVDAGTEKTPGFKFSYWEMKARFQPSFHSSDHNLSRESSHGTASLGHAVHDIFVGRIVR